VAGVVCPLALVCLAIGVVIQIALQHSLIGRLDAQLTAAGGRSSNVGTPPEGGVGRGQSPPREARGAQFLLAPGPHQVGRSAPTGYRRPDNAAADREGPLRDGREVRTPQGRLSRADRVGANTVGHIATILTGAVRDITREVGGFVTDVFEVREAAAKARADEKAISPTEAVIEDKQA